MLKLDVNGTGLQLRSGTDAPMELVPPLFADGIEDSFSTPFEVPVDGNEPVLGHVQELSLRERDLVLRPAELHHEGLRLHKGELVVLASTPDTVRMSFVEDAFAATLKGVMLPDTLRQVVLDRLLEETEEDTDLDTRPLYGEGGKCQFPMFLNPQQYGDERPSWNPNASAWDEERDYDLNDLVEFTELSTIERTYVFQCIDAGGTSAGESPNSAPTKWRRTSFGLVNAWNKTDSTHYLNTVEADFYTMVPWFYVKWVIKQALANLGFTAKGTWMDDEATHELLLPNTTTIDSASQADPDYGFSVRQSTPVYYTPGDDWRDYRIACQDETTPPLNDVDSMWDNSAMEWTCPAAGTWVFRITLRMNRSVIDLPDVFVSGMRVYMLDASNTQRALVTRYFGPGEEIFAVVELEATMSAGDVGQAFHFAARQNASWPSGAGDHYTYAAIQGVRQADTPGVCVPDQYIYPHRHVPDVELGAFLLAWADAYNLKVTPDMDNRTVRLDYRERVLLEADGQTTEQSHRQVGTPELDHERRTLGMRLRWEVENNVADEQEEEPSELYYSEDDLVQPSSVGRTALVLSTRKLLRSAFVDGTFVWRQVGYHIPGFERGDTNEAREVVPAVVPLHMEQVYLDSYEYLVPVLDQQGTSAFYHGKGEQSTIYACLYKKGRSGDGSVTNVPLARSWGYGWDNADRADSTLLWDSEAAELPGMYQRCWQAWVAMLLSAEPVTMDLLLDMPFLLSKDWQRFLHMRGHRYLCERLPVSYGTTRAELVSQGAYLLKLNPYHPQPLGRTVPSVLFTNSTSGTMEIYTSTGYVTLQNEVGQRTVFTTGDPPTGYIPVTLATAGQWRAWSSDVNGNHLGRLIQLIWFDPILSAINPAGLVDLEGLQVSDSPITELALEGCTEMRNVQANGCAIADVDRIFNALNQSLAGGTVFVQGGTSAAPTAASLAARTALLANGWTILTN